MSAQHLRLILTESPGLIYDIHDFYPELSILRDFAQERIADGTWDPKAQIPAHSLLAWAETRALEVADAGASCVPKYLPLQWKKLILKGWCFPKDAPELRGYPALYGWMRYLADLHDFRRAHHRRRRPVGIFAAPPEYPRPEGEVLRELEAAEDAARWAHLMQLWTAHTGKTWGQSCQST